MEILVLLAIGFGIYLFYSMRQGWREGFRRGQAQAVERGAKPWGKPMGFGYGGAYFMVPEQIIQAGIGLPVEALSQKFANKDLNFLLTGHLGHKGKEATTILEGDGHLLTIAPTRAGKGVSAVIPNLLFYGGSMVVNDIKGENYAVTADWRRQMGHRVLKFAPFDDDTDFWNPFDLIEEGDEAWEDVRTFAELLIVDRGGKDEFWNNEARNLLSGVLLYIVTELPEEEHTMWTLRHFLTLEAEELELFLREKMLESKTTQVQRAASAFLQGDAKVRAGIMSTLNSHMGIWDSPRLQRMMAKNTYRLPRMLLEPITVYFSIPPGRLDSYAPVIRLFMGTLIKHFSGYTRKGDYPVLFMLDEFPALGRMKVIEEGITYMAGYGISFWLFAQDLKQLAAVYGDKANSIIANCAVKQFFGAADVETAQMVSLMCGETTTPTISYSNEDGLTINNGNLTLSSGARPLMTPNEIMNFPANSQLLFYRGQQVISAVKFNYLEDPIFRHNDGTPIFDANPYHD
jgi:type IV secretion system protein VirD4